MGLCTHLYDAHVKFTKFLFCLGSGWGSWWAAGAAVERGHGHPDVAAPAPAHGPSPGLHATPPPAPRPRLVPAPAPRPRHLPHAHPPRPRHPPVLDDGTHQGGWGAAHAHRQADRLGPRWATYPWRAHSTQESVHISAVWVDFINLYVQDIIFRTRLL